jgi:hypothetical protein
MHFQNTGHPCLTFSIVMSGGQRGILATLPCKRMSSRKRFLSASQASEVGLSFDSESAKPDGLNRSGLIGGSNS